MPSPLQLPTAVTIHVFWMFLITPASEKNPRPSR
jgi:hypothetical protein